MLFAFLNTRGWNEEKWRTLIEEGKEYSVIGIAETGWHNSIEWNEGGWLGVGRGRKIGEKKGGGVGIVMREKEGRRLTTVKLSEEAENKLDYNKGDIITVKISEEKEVWWVTVVYMGVEGRDNHEENIKLYKTLLDIRELIGKDKWVIMGDLNGHIGLINEKVNTNGQLLIDFIEKTGYKVKNWELDNPVTWSDKGNVSAIDYIIVNEEIEKLATKIWKNENIDMSDHTMIGITCRKSTKKEKTKKVVWKEKWDLKNADWSRYREELEAALNDDGILEDEMVTDRERELKEIIKREAKKSVGIRKLKVGKTKLKGWWDIEVKKAIENRKRENRKQRNLAKMMKKYGKTYENDWKEAWNKYSETKKTAQSLIRKKIGRWEEEQTQALNNMPRREREKEGWRRLKKSLGSDPPQQEIRLKLKGRETTDKKEIISEVESFWRNVIWKEEKAEVVQCPMIYSDTNEMPSVQIETQDIDAALKAIKLGKAGGTDGVIGEFIKYGGDVLKRSLLKMFREILEKGEVPQDWLRSRVTLIHKGGGKAKEVIGNYRPIAVINILAKIFGWIMNSKLMKWAEESKALGEEQSGFRKGRGGLENAFVIKEIIERSKHLGRELYLTFIDIEKAYDTIDRQKLLVLLEHIGVEGKVVQVIKKMYEENKVKFTLGELSTSWLKNNVGVRQGCVISPTLFNLYIEELIVRIRKSEKGVQVGNKRLGCLAYADDIVLMAESKEDMEELVKIADTFGREWNIKYSARKCKVMEFGSKEEGQWILGNNILEVVDSYTYLGLEVSKEGIGGQKQRRINEGKARRMTGMIINGGMRAINKYNIGRSLWKGMAVPYCLYGSEITHYTEGDLQKLEKTQNIVGRWSLGAPRCTAVEAIRGEMGWSTFKERILKGKFNLLKKIEGLDADRWAKRIMEEGVNSPWKREVERWKRRENLTEDWYRMSAKDTKKRIEENGRDRWQQGMESKSTLRWYRRKEKPEALQWHSGDWGSRLLTKARTGTLEVQARNRDEPDQDCSFCRGQRETIEHLLVECVGYEEERGRLVRSIIAIIGEEEWSRRIEEEDQGISTALGLYGDKDESERVIENTKLFLIQAWEKRCEVQSETSNLERKDQSDSCVRLLPGCTSFPSMNCGRPLEL